MERPEDDITELLASATEGGAALTQIFPKVYEALRQKADAMLFGNDRRQVDPTSMVHEAYLKLVDQHRSSYESRLHFLAVAAMAIRRLLVDRARHDRAAKRGGDMRPETLDGSMLAVEHDAIDPIDVDDALTRLTAAEPRVGKLVELRFFGGLTMAEAAEHLGVSTATAERDWRYARAWLYRELQP